MLTFVLLIFYNSWQLRRRYALPFPYSPLT